MRFFSSLLAVIFLGYFVIGFSLPYVTIEKTKQRFVTDSVMPFEASDEVPTFKMKASKGTSRANLHGTMGVVGNHHLNSDSSREAEFDNLRDMIQIVRDDPCDVDSREKLAKMVVTYMKNNEKQKPDREVGMMIIKIMTDGVLLKQDFPVKYRQDMNLARDREPNFCN